MMKSCQKVSSRSLLKRLTLIGKSWKTHPEIFPNFQCSGVWHRPISGKLIHFFRNFNSGASHRPFYWKTHPLKIMSTIQFFFTMLGRHTDHFTGKFIHILTETVYDMKHLVWMSFPVKRPVWYPGILQLTIGWVFQSNGLRNKGYLYWQISGQFLRPFYWKTHPSKNHDFFFKLGR